MTKVLVPLGTRPEIVKLAPVVAALHQHGHVVRTVATGQHYSPSMSDAFFDDLGLRPDERWELDGDESDRVGAILGSALRELDERRPDVVLLLGDTWTVPLFCMAARRHGVPLAHLEAGLRSFNPTSVEEVNRKVAAATASLHLAPTELAARFLRYEGVLPERIRVVGNPVIDVLQKANVPRVPIHKRAGVVVTAHRATNVDDPDRLTQLVTLLQRLAREVGPVTFPVHPRTRARLEVGGSWATLLSAGPEITLLEPLAYEDMLARVAAARVVVTDSGGLQEEASWFGVPVVVLRRSTPRWEGVGAGIAALVGLDVDLALDAAVKFCTAEEQRRVASSPCPYGDGRTSTRVARLLADPRTAELLELAEPDFVARPVPA
jgi:UDP-N-acetylglucosamine 2-epimerase (non-hydrolysing)